MFFTIRSLGTSANIPKLVASVSGGTATAVGVGNGPFTTNSIVASATGGVSPYTYAWSSSAGNTVSISSSTATTVSWSASGTAPASSSATWACVVTDSAGVSAATNNVSVNISFNLSSIAASLSTNTLSYSRTGDGALTTDAVTVTASNGTAPYTYSWTKVSGTTLTLSNASGASTTFSYTGTVGNTITAVYQCVVTDAISDTVNAGSVSITLTYSAQPLGVSISPTSVLATSYETGTPVTSEDCVATVTGGTAPYTYQWSYVSGDNGIYAVSPTGASTLFSRYGSPINTYDAYWKVTVTDSNSQVATSSSVYVEINFEA